MKGAETERVSTGEGRRLQAVRGVWREHSFSRLWFWLERKICLSLCALVPVKLWGASYSQQVAVSELHVSSV